MCNHGHGDSIGSMILFFSAYINPAGATTNCIYMKEDYRRIVKDYFLIDILYVAHRHAAVGILQKILKYCWTAGYLYIHLSMRPDGGVIKHSRDSKLRRFKLHLQHCSELTCRSRTCWTRLWIPRTNWISCSHYSSYTCESNSLSMTCYRLITLIQEPLNAYSIYLPLHSPVQEWRVGPSAWDAEPREM